MRFIGIDPATRTGFVALDENANVLVAEELKGQGKGAMEVKQLVSLEDALYRRLLPEDEIVLEDTAMGTQRGITTGMIHGGLRSMICRKGLEFQLVNPLSTKSYVAVTGWTGDVGKKRRLKDAEKKKAVEIAVLQHFGFTHKSDNVIDAYIIARIALNVYRRRELLPLLDTKPYQIDVIEKVLREKVAG